MEERQRCVIIGAAEMQNYEKIKTHFRNDDYYIYCDAGLKHQDALGVWPDLIIGDFDSYSKAEMERKYQHVGDTSMPADANTAACGDAPELIVLPCEKDDTDTVFAVKPPNGIHSAARRFIKYGTAPVGHGDCFFFVFGAYERISRNRKITQIGIFQKNVKIGGITIAFKEQKLVVIRFVDRFFR